MTGSKTKFNTSMETARSLADRTEISNIQVTPDEPWYSQQVHTVRIGEMLAHVTVIPDSNVQGVMYTVGGNLKSPADLRVTVDEGCFDIRCEIPFNDIEQRPASSINRLFSRKRVQTLSFSGSINVSGSVTIDGNTIIADNAIIIDNKQVDTDYAIDVIIYVPVETQIIIDEGFIGAVGIAGGMQGNLCVTNSSFANVFAHSASSAIIDVTGSGDVEVGSVEGALTVKTDSSGNFQCGSVSGMLIAKTDGSGDITIKGGETDGINAQTRGIGDIKHWGTVNRVAILETQKSGDITIRKANGDVEATIGASGNIEIQGGTFDSLTVKGSGSGDFEHYGIVNGPVQLDASASGCMTVKEANGDVGVMTAKSGDILIRGGTFTNLVSKTFGSGEVCIFGTVAGDASLSAAGSGDTEVREVAGKATIRRSGSSTIEITRHIGEASVEQSGSGDVIINGEEWPKPVKRYR